MTRPVLLVRSSACVGRFGYCFVALLIIAPLLAGCASRDESVNVTAILERVHQGETREQALHALADAWFHSTCDLSDLNGEVMDFFLYGPKERNKVILIYVHSIMSENRLVVEEIGQLESYYIDNPNLLGCCEPPLPQAFETPQAR